MKKCEMFGCKGKFFLSYSVAPGTVLDLCKVHYNEIRSEKEGL